jgi:soluble lytic murein transglycosylase-like protein
MKNRFSLVLGGIVLISSWSLPANASEKIRAYVDSNGRIVYTNTMENPSSSTTVKPVVQSVPASVPNPIHALIDSIATNHGVDPALVKAMVRTESNYNRWAVSNKGALGLMQLIPTTGARFGVQDFFDPKQNIEGGVRYMKFLLAKFNGDLDLSLAAYNAGENLVERLGRIPAIPETRNYVRKVRAHYGKREHQAVAAEPLAPTAVAKPIQTIFRSVDERGVVHFSNVAPPK